MTFSENFLQAERYYDTLADIYDQATLNAWSPPQQIAALITLASIPEKNVSVLDIGIGTGQCIKELYQQHRFSVIEGIDTSQKMLEQCRHKFPETILHHGDFSTFKNFTRSEYDLILCSGVLEFIADLDGFLEKCRHLLRKHGNIFLTYELLLDAHPVQSKEISLVGSKSVENFMTFRRTKNQFEASATKNGLQIVQEKTFVAYNKAGIDILYTMVQLIIIS